VICFDDYIGNNYHLGGIKVGGTKFLWRASPSWLTFNGKGGYEISNGVNYAGSDVQAFDRHVVFGYHGEFFRSQGQAGQHLHFYETTVHRPVCESAIGYRPVMLSRFCGQRLRPFDGPDQR